MCTSWPINLPVWIVYWTVWMICCRGAGRGNVKIRIEKLPRKLPASNLRGVMKKLGIGIVDAEKSPTETTGILVNDSYSTNTSSDLKFRYVRCHFWLLLRRRDRDPSFTFPSICIWPYLLQIVATLDDAYCLVRMAKDKLVDMAHGFHEAEYTVSKRRCIVYSVILHYIIKKYCKSFGYVQNQNEFTFLFTIK